MKDDGILTGTSESHLVTIPSSKVRVHQGVRSAYEQMRSDAAKAGFDLQIISGFRSFSDQLRIWNLKAQGQRPVLDSNSQPIDVFSIASIDLVNAILRWSALPAASRHHWGTDIDVIDAKALPQEYRVQLIPEEVDEGGMFAPLHEWLDENMLNYGFYRPYDRDRGGVSPERWHLSYFPLAGDFTNALTEAKVISAWEGQSLQLRDVVEKNLSDLFAKFVKNIAPAPPIN